LFCGFIIVRFSCFEVALKATNYLNKNKKGDSSLSVTF